MPARDDSDSFRIAHGPLALEQRLERDVRDEHARARADPSALRAPILIVVPSRSLRVHIVRKLAEWCGGAAAGWRVVTLFGLAREVCTTSSTTVPRGARLFEPLVARAVARSRGLSSALTAFEDGARVASPTIADLVDAGFVPASAPELLRRLDALARSITATELSRARALVEIATDVARESEKLDVARSAQMLRCASDAVARGATVVRARAVWIHGFADATGAAAELLAALQAHARARIYWDACADDRFGQALREHLSISTAKSARVEPARCDLARASSVDVEVRCVADRVRALIDAGTPAESIGVVARDLGPYRVALRRHFARLAIPFSGESASAPDGPSERRAKALAECVSKGADAPIDRWLDARAESSFGERAAQYELRIALRALGVATLNDLAALDIDVALAGRPSLALPLRGITTVEDCDADERADVPEPADETDVEELDASTVQHRMILTKRSIARADLERERELARASVRSLEDSSGSSTVGAPVSNTVQRLRILAIEVLAWPEDSDETRILDAAAVALATDLFGDLALAAADVRSLIEQEIVVRATRPIGGAGGGVACLTVVEARARTFDTLFVMGLVRGKFPRNVREDPLLSDAVRGAWKEILPHLPVKSVGRDEERVLFDQLVRSARSIHLSWITLDADNKALLPSPLLERAVTHADITAVPLAVDTLTHDGPASDAIRPAHEHAVTAALRGGIDGLERLLPTAVAETRTLFGLDATRSPTIARARIAILREHEPGRHDAAALGPYFGMIGQLAAKNDLRHGDLHVTQLEAVAACGWKALLMRVLRLEPPLDPLDVLPDLDARLVGDVVHVVLQSVVESMKGPVRWPSVERVEEFLHDAARTKLRARGTFVPGFETLVATRARPMIAAARALDETEPDPIRSARSEVQGGIDLPEGALGPRRLMFRADRVDELGDARADTGSKSMRWTDYKTGKPISEAQRVETRTQHLLAAIARGKSLQAMAYAIAADAPGSGRYVYLREGVEPEKRVFAVSADDASAREAFDEAIDRLVGAFDMGVLFPRLLDADTHRTNGLCASCEMAQACLRGDSGANRRLAEFVRARTHADPAQQVAHALWSLSSLKVTP